MTKCSRLIIFIILAFCLHPVGWAIDYKTEVLPIIKEHCSKCHEGDKARNGYDFITLKGDLGIRANIGKYNIIRPGNIEEGTFLGWMQLPESHSDFMPRKGSKVPDKQLEVIKKWILAGAIVDKDNMTETELKLFPDPKAYHKWKNTEGTEIEARYRGIKGEAVEIVMKNGNSFVVPFAKLSKESVELAKKLGGTAEKKLNKSKN